MRRHRALSFFPGCWCYACKKTRKRVGIPFVDLRREYGPIETRHRMAVELAGGRCRRS